MKCTVLYIFVEGPDDFRFFDRIIVPLIKEKHNVPVIHIIESAKLSKGKIRGFLQSINSVKEWDYIFVRDLNDKPCVTARKREIKNILKDVEGKIIDEGRIIVVVREIEGWYLAGLSAEDARELKVKELPPTTDNLTKEQFNRLIPEGFYRLEFMLELLDRFSIKEARKKNRSFDYFIEKYKLC